jgi:D-amino peptidase
MNVYVMTDMEGISGLNSAEQCRSGKPQWEAARTLMEGDFNAAIAGAAAAGAARIVLNDAHGGGNGNIRVENMDERAEYERPQGGANMMPALNDGKFDVGFHIGAHAMAGTANAFLSHTQSSVAWHNYSVNGERWGEIAQFAAYLGHFDVPLVLVTGDEAACAEARKLLGEEIDTVAVKTGIGRQRARCLAPAVARARIQEAAARAVRLSARVKPFKPKFPVEVEIEFHYSSTADRVACSPGMERVDGRTVRKTASNARELVGW